MANYAIIGATTAPLSNLRSPGTHKPSGGYQQNDIHTRSSPSSTLINSQSINGVTQTLSLTCKPMRLIRISYFFPGVPIAVVMEEGMTMLMVVPLLAAGSSIVFGTNLLPRVPSTAVHTKC